MIKAIIFDAGEIVYYRDEETLKPIIDFLKKKCLSISTKQFKKALDEYILEAYKGRISKDEHLKKTLEVLNIKFDSGFFNEFVQVFRENYSNIKIRENISEVFEKIKSSDIKIAILTDTFTTEEKKWEWFKGINVAQFIDVIVCSSVTGHTKDEKEAYETALQKLRIKPEDAIFVGHNEYEMKGSKLAGIKSISLEKNIGEDYYIQDISKILDLIKNLE